MSAPYIIPFNFQPVNTGVSTSSYTVPTGKYARVNIKNALLPTLNGTNLYQTKNYGGANLYQTTTATTLHNIPDTNAHRVNFSIGSSTGQTVVVKLGGINATINDYHVTISTNSSGSYLLTPNTRINSFSSLTTTGTCYFSTVSVDTCELVELWLKPGDIIGMTSGVIVYEEYNAIS